MPIKPSPFIGRKSLAETYLAKCMEGPNRGKPGPCPDPNAQAKKASKKTGGGSAATGGGAGTGLIARGVARERAKQEQYTGFLRDEFQDNRTQYHEATRSFRAGQMSEAEYVKAMQEYEQSRHKYVSRLGMSGVKKIAIALGVTAAAVGTAYLGYKYAGTIAKTAKQLDGMMQNVDDKKRLLVYSSLALGGITTAAEALKGNSTVDPVANTAKRVVEVLATKPKEEKEELTTDVIVAMEDIKRRGPKADPRSLALIFDRTKKIEADLASGKYSDDEIKDALMESGDATTDPAEFREFMSKFKTRAYDEAAYLDRTVRDQRNHQKEVDSKIPLRRAVFDKMVANSPNLPGRENYRLIMTKKPAERTPQEAEFVRSYKDRVEKHILDGRLDNAILAEALVDSFEDGYSAYTVQEFKERLSWERRRGV